MSHNIGKYFVYLIDSKSYWIFKAENLKYSEINKVLNINNKGIKMRIKAIAVLLFFGITMPVLSQENQFPNVNVHQEKIKGIPSGWTLAGSNPRDYEIIQDNVEPFSGYFSSSLKSVVNRPQGYVTLMQSINSDKYKGARIRFSGYVKAKFVADWASLWMRVDDVIGRPISFDNMNDRPIVGTSDWVKYEVVLDVPVSASEISFGVLLDGKGQIWFDKMELNVVGMDVPVTDRLKNKIMDTEPRNLDFEQ